MAAKVQRRWDAPAELSAGSEQPDAIIDTALELPRPLCRALIVLTAGVAPTLPWTGLPRLPQSELTCTGTGRTSVKKGAR